MEGGGGEERRGWREGYRKDTIGEKGEKRKKKVGWVGKRVILYTDER